MQPSLIYQKTLQFQLAWLSPEERVKLETKVRDLARRAGEILAPITDWDKRCHEASLKLVDGGVGCRVARGWAQGVRGQHSWVVETLDGVYDLDALIIDPTLSMWWNQGPYIWVGSLREGLHHPHGAGDIRRVPDDQWPKSRGGEPIELNVVMTEEANRFLEKLGPLDHGGWSDLAKMPMGGWPSGEIIEAMSKSGLNAVIPIDILGMVTDLNPSDMYLPKSR